MSSIILANCAAHLSVSALRAMASGPPTIVLYSIGWSDVPDHYQKLKGFVFDIETMGRDADRTQRQWPYFGGENGTIDTMFAQLKGMAELLALVQSLIETFLEGLTPHSAEALQVTVCCAWENVDRDI